MIQRSVGPAGSSRACTHMELRGDSACESGALVQVLLLVDDDVRYDVAVHEAVKTMQLYERAQVSALSIPE
jgi:hypothetical protein